MGLVLYFGLLITRVSWVGSVLWTDLAQPLTTAAEELDHLYHLSVDDLHDLYDV